jgi:hypothetical protein
MTLSYETYSNDFRELCYILNKRNTINSERSKARYKVRYYRNAAYTVRTHSTRTEETLSKARAKWLKLGSSKLELKALKYDKLYVAFKLKTLRFTKKFHNKVIKLAAKERAKILWDNGYVEIYTLNKMHPDRYINKSMIAKIAEEYKISKAIDSMLHSD